MRLPVDPTTCTVLGSKARSVDDPLWAGLDLSKAELREWPGDHHLGVPWEHLEDRKFYGDDPDFWAIYRVRPVMEPGKLWKGKKVTAASFSKAEGAWWIDVEFA